MTELVSIKEILANPSIHAGWLFLPKAAWTLDTQGVFYKEDPDTDSEEDNQSNLSKNWQEVLDRDGIEDVIENAKMQVENPTSEQLLEALRCYFTNDAYMTF